MDIALHERDEDQIAAAKRSLSEAVERLYSTFERYKLRPTVGGCDHCVSLEDNARIHSKSLRRLVPNDLERFAHKALTTWGDEDDFRHFLPRLFELMTESHDRYYVDPSIITGKLPYAHWERWNHYERSAIESFFQCYWSRVLSEYPCELATTDDALCTIASAVDDLNPYLAVWISSDASACAHLADFIIESASRFCRKKVLQNAFWSDRPEQVTQVVHWLKTEDVSNFIEQAFFTFEKTEPSLAAACSYATTILQSVRNADATLPPSSRWLP